MEWSLALAGVFWLGIQTALCPCPLATGLAAIAYIGRRVGHPRETLFSGILYALGQMLAYLALSLVVLGLPFYSGDQVSRFLSLTFHAMLGPVLVLIGMVLTGLVDVSRPLSGCEKTMPALGSCVERLGFWSAFPLGVFFALAFCPTTAAMYLAMLVLSAKAHSTFLFPLVYGLGLSLPVVFFAVLLTFQIRWFGRAYHFLETAEKFLRNAAGWLLIGIGLILTIPMFL